MPTSTTVARTASPRPAPRQSDRPEIIEDILAHEQAITGKPCVFRFCKLFRAKIERSLVNLLSNRIGLIFLAFGSRP